MKKISLLKLREKEKAKIVAIAGGGTVRHRLMSMGIYPGREISKLSQIALRGPVTIKAGRSHIALGHGMAQKIIVETE